MPYPKEGINEKDGIFVWLPSEETVDGSSDGGGKILNTSEAIMKAKSSA